MDRISNTSVDVDGAHTKIAEWASVLAAVLIGGLIIVVPATAARAHSESSHEYSQLDILTGVTDSQADAESAELVEDYVASNARLGILTDTEEVTMSVLPDQTQAGSEISILWSSQVIPENIFIGRDTYRDGGEVVDSATAVGLLINESSENSVLPDSLGGSGFEYASPSGAYLHGNGSATIRLDNSTGSKEHIMNTLWQKFAVSGTDIWYYNRYGNIDLNPAGVLVGVVSDYTIRSRPANQDLSKFSSVLGHAPSNYESLCGSSTPTVSLIVAGGSGITIPIEQCDNVSPIFIASDFHFGASFTGIEAQEWMGLDSAMVFRTTDNVVIPSFADYNWAEIGECINFPVVGCTANVLAQWDTSW